MSITPVCIGNLDNVVVAADVVARGVRVSCCCCCCCCCCTVEKSLVAVVVEEEEEEE